jgi:tRNA A-37 threonylcarbamoyl transferase component Bud32
MGDARQSRGFAGKVGNLGGQRGRTRQVSDVRPADARETTLLAPTALFTIRPPGILVTDGRMTPAFSEVLASPIRWQLSPALAAHWPDPSASPLDEWMRSGRGQIIKRGPHRTVYRFDLPGLSIYVKQHHLPDRVTRLRQCLRAPKAKREFDRLVEFARRGVPAPQPLGWGAAPGWASESLIITRALDDVTPLNRIFVAGAIEAKARRNLAEHLGRFVARLHGAGVDHRDLHSGNIVVRQSTAGDVELFLVDLDAVRLTSPLPHWRSIANLSLFAGGCLPATTRTDRLRFLRSYVYERRWLDPARDAAGARKLFALARAVEAGAWQGNLASWARRDGRCLVSNRYYRSVTSPSHSGMAVRGVDERWLKKFADDPDALFDAPNVRMLKHSNSSTVAEIDIVVDGESRRAILKKIGATRWSDPVAALVRPTPILRSWVAGQGFLERNLPTPRPLAMLHRRQRGLPHDGYLVTEKLDDAATLLDYVADLETLPRDEAQRRLRRQIDRTARAIREMHRCGISHRDLKAANVLVTAVATEETPAGEPKRIWASPFVVTRTNLWFIDLVGTSQHSRLSKRRRVQNLARLNTSFRFHQSITRADRLRFLRTYLGWGIHGKDNWKDIWRLIARATDAKVERNARSGRVLG